MGQSELGPQWVKTHFNPFCNTVFVIWIKTPPPSALFPVREETHRNTYSVCTYSSVGQIARSKEVGLPVSCCGYNPDWVSSRNRKKRSPTVKF